MSFNILVSELMFFNFLKKSNLNLIQFRLKIYKNWEMWKVLGVSLVDMMGSKKKENVKYAFGKGPGE